MPDLQTIVEFNPNMTVEEAQELQDAADRYYLEQNQDRDISDIEAELWEEATYLTR